VPNEVARILARILDGQRPVATNQNGRPLLTYAGFLEVQQVLDNNQSATLRNPMTDPSRFGTARFGIATFAQSGTVPYGTAIYGTFKYGE